ncbi:hypothetical protein [Bradyrhizobium sp.]|uniref:hypothetical protein n=1 Tax=Bradyrhizobium sp. TaxID=376 RepID=UPI002635A69E|nr:hypothetical protein [Bradyrhizobium sp.]
MFTALQNIADVSLGYKSLQNNFFYVNAATISTYGIEKKYLVPILVMRDLNASNYEQYLKPSHWLFACKDKRGDLRGTGAWRYIEAMADRSAAEKKQSGKNLTIREALEAQSGGTWYAPKAKPASHHVWLRKAVNTVYAPFLFKKATLVDQRLNSVSALGGVTWQEVAAALTSSLFAYSLEINGAASMGAGALEAPTTKLRGYPVLDVRELKKTERTKLVALAEEVWQHEQPTDWGASSWQPKIRLQKLDEWILSTVGRNVTAVQMYEDIRSTCEARIAVADDKKRKTKKQQSDSIGSVAESIVKSIEPWLMTKNFPDDFTDGAKLDLPLVFDRGSLKEITIDRLLDSYDIDVRARGGGSVYSATHPRPVAEAIIRAILLGRSTFSVSTDRKIMNIAVEAFLKWVAEAEEDIDAAIRESAFGTGYEEALKREIYSRLGIHPLTGAADLPVQISL